MLPEHRKELLTILAGVDQLRADAERIIANPIYPDIFVRAEEVQEILADMQARIEAHLVRVAER